MESKGGESTKKMQTDFLAEIVRDSEKQEALLFNRLIEAKSERNFYLNKLRQIEKLGERMNWEDESGLLQKLKNYFDSLGFPEQNQGDFKNASNTNQTGNNIDG